MTIIEPSVGVTMICELCGNPIERGARVRLEGSEVNACSKCAPLGEFVSHINGRRRERPDSTEAAAPPRRRKAPGLSPEFEVVEDYADRVRTAREKAGLRQDELAKKVREPASVIHRIESERMEPSMGMARKLEKTLRVTLLEKASEVSGEVDAGGGGELTLGDRVVIRGRER